MSLCEAAVGVLTAADPAAKVALTRAATERWRAGRLPIGAARPPDRPARPERPVLVRPGAMPKRSSGPKGRIPLVHALAHIELNAIDLAWDILARFGHQDLPRAFFDDWVGVALEEAEHFELLRARLEAWDIRYGDLPAHDGLWQAATLTADDLAARLALIPMTLEARGIDTTIRGATKLRQNDDSETVRALDIIYEDEIKHLAVGVRWFEFVCERQRMDAVAAYHRIVTERFTSRPKPPFNLEARARAGMHAGYLAPWLSE